MLRPRKFHPKLTLQLAELVAAVLPTGEQLQYPLVLAALQSQVETREPVRPQQPCGGS